MLMVPMDMIWKRSTEPPPFPFLKRLHIEGPIRHDLWDFEAADAFSNRRLSSLEVLSLCYVQNSAVYNDKEENLTYLKDALRRMRPLTLLVWDHFEADYTGKWKI